MAALNNDCAFSLVVIHELAEDVFELIVWDDNQDVMGHSMKPSGMLLVTRYSLDIAVLATTL